MKKYLALVLALILTLSLVACGNKTTETTPDENEVVESSPADGYPDHTVNIIVPFAAGSGSHALATSASNALMDKFASAVTNVEGGGGSTGAMEVLHSDPDGYTMLCSTTENIAAGRVNGTYSDPDAYQKFVCVGVVGESQQILIASKQSGFTTLEEVMEYATAHPGELTCSGATANSYTNAMALLIFKQLGVDIRFVPYDSVVNATTACMAGTIDLCLYGTDNASSALESGDCVGICMLSAERSSFFPDIPTAAESYPDLCKDFNYSIYRCFFMPPETPVEIADAMSAMLADLGNSQEFKDILTAQKLESNYKDRTEMAEILAARADECVEMYDLLAAQK